LPSRPHGNTGAVPLYVCDRCGFTSAAFRIDASRAHRGDYPECEGVVQIIFRSDERSRSTKPPLLSGARELAAPATPPQGSPAGRPHRPLELRERLDADATLRLTVLGDLDIAAVDKLTERLQELHATDHPVRIDLSRLAFIDSSGVQALIVALADAHSDGWQLEVAREVSQSVARAAEIVGIARALWPEDPGPARPARATTTHQSLSAT
jgi:anti-anti-sigma factor